MIEDKICATCRQQYGDQLNRPWAVFALEESDQTAKLIRRKNAHELSLEQAHIYRYTNTKE